MIVVQFKKVQVKIGEDVHNLRVPSNRELNDFIESKDSSLKNTIELLDKCGLPKDVAWDLDAESLQQIIEAITPQKKQ